METSPNAPLSSEQLETIKQLLVRKQNDLFQLEKNLETEAVSKEHGSEQDRYLIADLSSETQGREVDLILAESELTELKKIDYALQRLESNTYGHCEECEEPISHKRLFAIPETLYCLNCETELEDKEKSRKSPHSKTPFGTPAI